VLLHAAGDEILGVDNWLHGQLFHLYFVQIVSLVAILLHQTPKKSYKKDDSITSLKKFLKKHSVTCGLMKGRLSWRAPGNFFRAAFNQL
jgi:hypothetical protein